MWKFSPGQPNEGGNFYGPGLSIFICGRLDYWLQNEQITHITANYDSSLVVFHVLDNKVLISIGPANFVSECDPSFQIEARKMISSVGSDAQQISERNTSYHVDEKRSRDLIKAIEEQL